MLAKEATVRKDREDREDLRVRRTRHLLQEKFWELLAEQSFQSITIQDITARAMVNRATFYDHFVDKYALLQYSIREWFRDTVDKQHPVDKQHSAETGAGNLEGLIMTTCEFLAKLRYHCLPRDNAVLPLVQTTITDLIAELLLRWMAAPDDASSHDDASSRDDASSSDPSLRAAISSWAIYGAAYHWSQKEDREPKERFAQRVLPTIQASMEVC